MTLDILILELTHLGRVGCYDDPAEGCNRVRDVEEVVVQEAGSLTTNTINICKENSNNTKIENSTHILAFQKFQS